MSMIDKLKKMLNDGQDNALLRFGLGQAYLKEDRPDEAVHHLARAVEQDPDYSAAWKLYGKALSDTGALEPAKEAYEKGIAKATEKGDVQAAKEMQVFLKRVLKQLGEA